MSRKRSSGSGHFNPRRRKVLKGLAAAAGSAALPGYVGEAQAALPPLPAPRDSGIDHIVVVMMENRSFDHFLGWVPGATGGQRRQYPDRKGVLHDTFRLSANRAEYGFQGCGKEDPSHSYSGGRTHYNNGAMNGFLQTVSVAGDLFPIGYYNGSDLPFYKGVAANFTVCDHYFSGILSSTYPNRVYMHAGQTDRNNNTLPYVEQPPSTLPTIWDLLKAKNVSRRYYFNDLPFVGLWGPKYLPISRPYAQFAIDALIGQLPSVSFIDPFFGAGEGESPYGIARDDHPHSDVRDGQAFLDQIYNTLRHSPQWSRTLMIVNYDEWGGFFDHVPPPVGPVSAAERALGNDGRLGFRVPCVILGPRARRGYVSKLRFDPNSILNLIRWRFGLGPLSARDNWSNNLAYALDFDNPPNLSAPDFNVPKAYTGFGVECTTGLPFPLPTIVTADFLDSLSPVLRSLAEHQLELRSLMTLARKTGWPV